METIVAAGISAGATLIVAIIAYNYRFKKLLKDIEQILKLSEEANTKNHTFSNEHKNLTNEHGQIIRLIDASSNASASINDLIIETKVRSSR